MSARLLAIVLEGQEASVVTALPALAAVARAESACVRLAYLRSFPRPRVDRFDRVVVDTDREMARITDSTIATFAAAARPFDDFTMEVVVRFGCPRGEVTIESEVFAPDLVSVLAPRDGGPFRRFATWRLRRSIARCAPVRVIVLETLRRHAGRWPWLDARPRWRDVVRTSST